MNRFINFLGKMHSGGDDVSSKRVYATIFVLVVVAMVIGSQYFHKPLDFEVLITMLTTIGTLCGMNLTAQLKAIEAKKDVAGAMVNVTGDNDSAAGVIQSDKPNG